MFKEVPIWIFKLRQYPPENTACRRIPRTLTERTETRVKTMLRSERFKWITTQAAWLTSGHRALLTPSVVGMRHDAESWFSTTSYASAATVLMHSPASIRRSYGPTRSGCMALR